MIKSLHASSLDLSVVSADISLLNAGLYRTSESFLIPKVEEHGAIDIVGHGERGVSRSPVTHYVSAVERHRAFEDLVASRHQPSDAPPHAEACYANAVAVDGRVGGEEVYRGVHVGDDIRIFQVA